MMNRIYTLIGTLILLAGTACAPAVSAETTLVLRSLDGDGWSFSAVDSVAWMPARVPGCVHTDLLAAGCIGDPFWRDNEFRQQWIDKRDWMYRTVFRADEELLNRRHVELLFEGLDTYADVYLNGYRILSTDNMFRRWEADIRRWLVAGENELKIVFRSAVAESVPLFDAAPYRLFGGPGNDRGIDGGIGDRKIAVYNRKVPSHFGWDWGPRFVTCGIWRPVWLRAWNDARIADVQLLCDSLSEERARVTARVAIASDALPEAELSVHVDGREVTRRPADTDTVELAFGIDRPELWWPNGMGEPHLYDVEVRLEGAGVCYDAKRQPLGLRSVRVVREPDRWGKSFYFEVNGRPMFAKGANLIPTDCFLPRTDSADYQHLVDECVDAHFNMLRVWGGGLYEDDAFYEACDRAGILVWQDFIFACAMYPTDDAFRERVRAEAVDNIRRLRNHPSLAMWCGNNEMTQAWYNWGWSRNRTRTPEQRAEIWEGYRRIFFELLPELVAAHDPQRFYWPSSPSSEPHEPQNYASGDVHYWKYRPGRLPVSVFRTEMGRFMSEWGFNSAPTMPTIESYTEPGDRDMASPVFRGHVKSHFEPELSQYYVEQYYDGREDFASQVFLGQVHQAEAMKFVIERHRISRPFCMGTLYWQLNDCWPGNSWSTIDYYGRRKPAHYSVRRAYAPVLVAADQTADSLRVFLVNDPVTPIEGATLVARLLSFTGEELWRAESSVNVAGASSTLVWEESLPTVLAGNSVERVVLSLQVEKAGRTIASNEHLFTEVRNLQLPEPHIVVEQRREGDDLLLDVTSSCYAKYVTLGLADGCVPSDDCFDLLPGQKHVVRVKQAPVGVTCHVGSYLDYRK